MESNCKECSELQETFTQSSPTRPQAHSLVGKVILGTVGLTALGITAITVPFVAPGFRKVCLPFVPATSMQVENALSVLRKGSKLSLIDLGSGDGRIVSTYIFFANFN